MDKARDSRRRWRVRLVAWALAGLVLAVLWAFDPAQSPALPACPFHALTGWHCPGCGATRAAHHLLRGHLAPAVQCNALLVLLALGGGLVWLCRRLPRQRPPRIGVATPPWLGWAAVTAIPAFAVLRNLSREPYCRLAPPASVQRRARAAGR